MSEISYFVKTISENLCIEICNIFFPFFFIKKTVQVSASEIFGERSPSMPISKRAYAGQGSNQAFFN